MSESTWPVLELRYYTLHPGSRDTLIDLFDREFIEAQEALGCRLLGQFRVEDDPDRFVWLRAYTDMATRWTMLNGFYVESETWRTHAETARSTMVDSDNVLLLRPIPGGELRVPADRPTRDATALPPARVDATVYHPEGSIDEFAEFFDTRVAPVLRAAGIDPAGRYRTEPAPNDFPRLPVREGERVFVWFALFPDAERRTEQLAALSRDPLWNNDIRPQLDKRLTVPETVLRLAPTARSALR
ncbi:NIPSNAP family protein [Nocardia sp. CDC153]|uniref:NIPSNAP family protein n=1 Tax=Nocardia sp. CDC153 TaxID=3112167 RepID=UPI002DBB2066|nr:NIPSNAP family protein [Nocardia sp. CDC153]MEC3951457.1 NIPSNAP family protein [Nocardia sp. CDC153]